MASKNGPLVIVVCILLLLLLNFILLLFVINFANHVQQGLQSPPPASASQENPPLIPQEWVNSFSQGKILYYTGNFSNLPYLPFVGNGYVAWEYGNPFWFVSGVYNGPANSLNSPSHRARFPSYGLFTFEKQLKKPGDIIHTTLALDLQNACCIYRVIITGTRSLEMEIRTYAHRHYSGMLVTDMAITNYGPEDVDLIFEAFRNQNSSDLDITSSLDHQPTLSRVKYECKTKVAETNTSSQVTASLVVDNPPIQLKVESESKFSEVYVTSISTSLDNNGDTMKKATEMHDLAHDFGGDYLFKAHIDAWKRIWRRGIEVTGKDSLPYQQAIKSSLYYLLSSIRGDWSYSLSPGSLATNGYNGHIFWDAETWMLPALSLQHHEEAQSMIQYRSKRIPEAQLKAISYNRGWIGTMWPWESAFTGVEVNPTTADTGLREQHISADISLAIGLLWRVSHNITWLEREGYPVLEGVAKWIVSRVTKSKKIPGAMDFNDVIPPDEHADHVNNSAYTNVGAALALRIAMDCCAILGHPVVPEWKSVADGLILSVPYNATLGVTMEYESFPSKQVPKFVHDSTRPVKQADVILLGFPLGWNMSLIQRKNDLEYYVKLTDLKGPAMTWGMFAVGYLELAQPLKAHHYFLKSFRDNTHGPFKIWTETPNGGSTHFITGAGGFLQAVMFGYGGIRMTNEVMEIDSQLPMNCTSLVLKEIRFCGCKFDLTMEQSVLKVELLGCEGSALRLDLKQNTDDVISLQIGSEGVFSPPITLIPIF